MTQSEGPLFWRSLDPEGISVLVNCFLLLQPPDISKYSQLLSTGARLPLWQVSMVMDREAWHAAIHGVAKSWTQLNDWTKLNWCPFWKRPSCWERLKAGGEGDDRGWDGWMASLTRWVWVRVSSRSWWWTETPSVLWSMGLQRVGHDWATELNWSLNEQNSSWPYIYSLLCFSLLLIFLLDKTLII